MWRSTVFVNQPPPCQKNSCDSASPCFFLYVVKPPVISAELVQLDSSYTSPAVSRLCWWHMNCVPGSPGHLPLWVVFAAPISRSHWVVDIWRFCMIRAGRLILTCSKKGKVFTYRCSFQKDFLQARILIMRYSNVFHSFAVFKMYSCQCIS